MPKNIVSHTLSYSFHAVRRCLERGITEQNIMDTIVRGRRVAHDGEKLVFARGRMRVVVTESALVITAYRERKNNPKRNIRKARKRGGKWLWGGGHE